MRVKSEPRHAPCAHRRQVRLVYNKKRHEQTKAHALLARLPHGESEALRGGHAHDRQFTLRSNEGMAWQLDDCVEHSPACDTASKKRQAEKNLLAIASYSAFSMARVLRSVLPTAA
jgi:hypothetical protein